MFYLYVLLSEKDKELYIGSTNDLKRRFKEHNAGYVPSTKTRRPFTLCYYEAYRVEEEAQKREQQLKLRGRALHQLRRRIKLSTGRDHD